MSLYADENFPLRVVEELRRLGHNVLTALEDGKANKAITRSHENRVLDPPATAVELGALFDDEGGSGEVTADVCGAAEDEFLARQDVAFNGPVDLRDCHFDYSFRDLRARADDQCAVR
jgi:hypothetical protein